MQRGKTEKSQSSAAESGGKRIALELVRHSNHRGVEKIGAELGAIGGVRGNFKPAMQMRTGRNMNAAGMGVQQRHEALQQREHQENDEVDPHP